MRIMIITNSFMREIVELLRIAAAQGWPHELTVVMPDNQPSSALPPNVTLLRRALFFGQHVRAACFSPRLFFDMRRIRPDILHIFEEYSGVIAWQAVAFRNACSSRSRVMVYSAENISGNVSRAFRPAMRCVSRHADLAFVCSESVRDTLQIEGFRKPIEVIPLGVNTDIFQKTPQPTLKSQLGLDGKFVLGYEGRLLDIKGIFLLLDLLRQLPESAHLLMVGGGADEARFRQKAERAGVMGRVHLVGNVAYERLPDYLNCMDVGVVPSLTTPRWKEQFGRAIIEFMSCEAPVIGSDSGSIPEIIAQAGWMFKEANLADLRETVLRVMANPEQRKQAGKIGRERVLARYSVEVMCQKFFALYGECSAECGIMT